MDDQKTDREGGILKLLSWFTWLGLLGLAMIIAGVCEMFEPLSRPGVIIAGGILMGCAAISIAILAAAKN